MVEQLRLSYSIKFFILLASLTFIAIESFSQMAFIKEKTSGYRGKRATIGISTIFSLSGEPQHPTDTKPLGINKAFGASLQYALSNHTALRTAVYFSNTSASIGRESVKRSDSYDGYNSTIYLGDIYYNRIGYFVNKVSGRPRLSDKSIELEYKYFRRSKGAMSPVGSYFSGGIGIHNIETDLSAIAISVSNEDWRGKKINYTIKYKNPIEERTLVEVYAKFGYSLVVKKFLLIDASLRTGYMPPLLTSETSNMRKRIYERLRRKQIMNFDMTFAIPF